MERSIGSSQSQPVEARLIYPNPNYSKVGSIAKPTHVRDDNDDDQTIARRTLRVNHHPEHEYSYDPWSDIFIRGDFKQNKFKSWERKKSDRKSSLDYFEYSEDDFEYEEDEDVQQGYNRKPISTKNRRKKKPPMKNRQRRPQHQQQRPSGIYDYEDPLMYDSVPSKEMMMSEPTPSITRRVMDVFTPFSGGIVAVFAVLSVPFLLAAGYWLLVVNGPTPIVKARIDDAEFDGQQHIDDTGVQRLMRALYGAIVADFQNFVART